jgi:hypothetical protein
MPGTDATTDDGYALALEEARRALDEQDRAVAELRARAGTVISAATIATSFLGAPFVTAEDLGPATWIAIMAFVFLSFATLALLWPRWQLEFGLRAASIIDSYVEPLVGKPATSPRLRRNLALHMDQSAELNRARISRDDGLPDRMCPAYNRDRGMGHGHRPQGVASSPS